MIGLLLRLLVAAFGLWLASELTDVLQVWSDDTGTVIRAHTG